jgi:hypothetical protein
MKFDFIKSLLNEARDPNINYDELEKGGKVDTVIAELKGAKSKEATLLAKKFDVARTALKAATEQYNKLNEEITDLAVGLFDPIDAVTFRLVKTASVTLTLSRVNPPAEKEVVDYKEIYEKLIALVDGSLLEQINQIKAECTSITKSVPRKAIVNVKMNEGVISDIAAKAKAMLKTLFANVKKWMVSYDRQLKAIEKDIANITKI